MTSVDTTPSKWVFIEDHYHILSRLGKGTFGSVVQARHKTTGRLVAVKRIPIQLGNFASLKRVLREISIMRQLSLLEGAGSHISRLLDVRRSDEHVFLIMEAENMDLERLLNHAHKTQITERNAIKLIYRFLCSLNFVHSAGVLHRDLKPGNLLVNSALDVKICDFGLARTAPWQSTEETQSKRLPPKRKLSNHVCTRWYRPPEIILLQKDYDSRVDVWGAGCIFAEIISSTTPYLRQGLDPKDRYVFQGTSCYPLSPAGNGDVQDGDQLQIILQMLGRQSDSALSFLGDPDVVDYIRLLQKGASSQAIDFEQEFDLSSQKLAIMLDKMLAFNPHQRSSAADLLSNPIFDGCRDPKLEAVANRKVQLEVDSADAFDYSTMEASGKVSTAALILQEIDKEIGLLQQLY